MLEFAGDSMFTADKIDIVIDSYEFELREVEFCFRDKDADYKAFLVTEKYEFEISLMKKISERDRDHIINELNDMATRELEAIQNYEY